MLASWQEAVSSLSPPARWSVRAVGPWKATHRTVTHTKQSWSASNVIHLFLFTKQNSLTRKRKRQRPCWTVVPRRVLDPHADSWWSRGLNNTTNPEGCPGCLPSCSFFVDQKCHVWLSVSTYLFPKHNFVTLNSPKSDITTFPFSKKIFLLFKSLCTIPFACK